MSNPDNGDKRGLCPEKYLFYITVYSQVHSRTMLHLRPPRDRSDWTSGASSKVDIVEGLPLTHGCIMYVCLALCYLLYTCIHFVLLHPYTSPVKKRGIVSIFMDEDNEFRAALKPSVSGTAVQFQSFCPQAQCVPCLLCTENWNHLRSTIWFSKFTVDQITVKNSSV